MLSGLSYKSDYISEDEEKKLIELVDLQIWQDTNTMKRRVQHYGYVYDYRRRTVDKSMYLGQLPDWLGELAQRLHDDSWVDAVPDQVIINEYVPGQGIALHVDCEPCFGDTIISLSLGSSCVMNFQHTTKNKKVSQLLEPRSVVILKDTARFDWKHGIAARKSDHVDEQIIKRNRRLSLTFRNVVLSE